jgi:hypothetical protein
LEEVNSRLDTKEERMNEVHRKYQVEAQKGKIPEQTEQSIKDIWDLIKRLISMYLESWRREERLEEKQHLMS